MQESRRIDSRMWYRVAYMAATLYLFFARFTPANRGVGYFISESKQIESKRSKEG